MINCNRFNALLKKKKCSEYEYKKYKEQFDEAVKSGMITRPERLENKLTHGGGEEIQPFYHWDIVEEEK